MAGPPRVLALPAGAVDDLAPLVPALAACRSAGVTVVVGASGAALGTAARAGLPAVDLDPAEDGEAAAHRAVLARALAEGGEPGTAVGPVLAALTARTVDTAVALGRALAPDLVLHTPGQPLGPLTAAVLGVPRVVHGDGLLGAGRPRWSPGPWADPWYARHGLDGPDPSAAVLDLCPPSLRCDRLGGVPVGWRPDPMGSPPGSTTWGPDGPRRPRVAVRVGGQGPVSRGDAHRLTAALTACAAQGVEVVLVGHPLPAGYRVDHHVRLLSPVPLPVGVVLPRVDALVHHGDPTLSLAALAHGVPPVVVSTVAPDGPVVEARGAGVRVPPRAPELLGAALHRVLADPATRAAVADVAAEIAGLPGAPEVVVGLVAELVRPRPGLPDAA